MYRFLLIVVKIMFTLSKGNISPNMPFISISYRNLITSNSTLSSRAPKINERSVKRNGLRSLSYSKLEKNTIFMVSSVQSHKLSAP